MEVPGGKGQGQAGGALNQLGAIWQPGGEALGREGPWQVAGRRGRASEKLKDTWLGSLGVDQLRQHLGEAASL